MSTDNYLQIIGCGHSESLEHFNNNALVKSPKGRMLIDCGHTIKHALHAQGLSFADIDAIYISHVHGDHAYGLERVAYETKFTYKKKIQLIFHDSIREELWDQTLRGSLGKHGDGESDLESYFDVTAISGSSFQCLGNHYDIFPVKHTPNKPTYGLCLNEKIFYSSDTTAIPELVEAYPFTTGFHDVTLTEKNPVHAPLNELITSYTKEIRQKLYLMSYQDTWREYVDLVNQEFKGFATQGMKVQYE